LVIFDKSTTLGRFVASFCVDEGVADLNGFGVGADDEIFKSADVILMGDSKLDTGDVCNPG
jgi:hypothetical protein